jgi:hypothetical protein
MTTRKCCAPWTHELVPIESGRVSARHRYWCSRERKPDVLFVVRSKEEQQYLSERFYAVPGCGRPVRRAADSCLCAYCHPHIVHSTHLAYKRGSVPMRKYAGHSSYICLFRSATRSRSTGSLFVLPGLNRDHRVTDWTPRAQSAAKLRSCTHQRLFFKCCLR